MAFRTSAMMHLYSQEGAHNVEVWRKPLN